MKKIFSLILTLFASANLYSQTYTISFAATGAATTVDSVKVENLNHPASAKWHSGDIFQLVLSNGINEVSKDANLQVYPNPMQGQAEISFYALQAGNTSLSIFDFTGKLVLQSENNLTQGTQRFQLSGLGQGMYVLQIKGEGYFYTGKLLSQNANAEIVKMRLIGNEKAELQTFTPKSTKATITMAYTPGDTIRFSGYAGILTEIIKDVPTSSKTITFAYTVLSLSTVQIPAGTFTMGSPITEANRDTNEIQHQVTLTAFRMSTYEITNAQFAAFLNAKSIGTNGLYAAGAYPTQALIYASSAPYDFGLHYTGGLWVPVVGYENHPVIDVTWYGATEFATYVGASLPTEAQWEYACRGNTTTTFNTGTCLSNTQANYHWAYPYNTCTNTITSLPATTQIVGSYAANGYGLYDMHGNVLEWCSDFVGTYPTTPQTNPTGPTTGLWRVFRGGGWYYIAQQCRSAYRIAIMPEDGNHCIGLRIVFLSS